MSVRLWQFGRRLHVFRRRLRNVRRPLLLRWVLRRTRRLRRSRHLNRWKRAVHATPRTATATRLGPSKRFRRTRPATPTRLSPRERRNRTTAPPRSATRPRHTTRSSRRLHKTRKLGARARELRGRTTLRRLRIFPPILLSCHNRILAETGEPNPEARRCYPRAGSTRVWCYVSRKGNS